MSDIQPYRLAYNVLHYNLQRFGIPEAEIPLPKTEVDPELNSVIPGLSIAVVIYQISLRGTLKPLLDEEFPTVHNLEDFYTRFTNLINQSLYEDLSEQNENAVGPSGGATSANVSQNVEKSTEGDPSQGENPPAAVIKKGIPSSEIYSSEIPALIAYSLAVCTELILYERENEDNKVYLKHLPDMWVKYFDEKLKPFCVGDICNLNSLKEYIGDVYFPEKALNEFLSENRNEYNGIAKKWMDFSETCQPSPTDSTDSIEDVSISVKLRFSEIKKKFKVLKEVGKRWKSNDQSSHDDNRSSNGKSEDVPLLTDYSPSTPSPTAETAGRCNYAYEEC